MADIHHVPAKILPAWALAYFNHDRSHRRENEPGDGSGFSGVHIDDELPHRTQAFYRLFCSDNDGMRRVWEQADKIIDHDAKSHMSRWLPGAWLLSSLIYGTDDAVEDERVPRYDEPPRTHNKRLSREQTAARKVAQLLQALPYVTPRDCHAKQRCHFIGTIEWIVVSFDFKLGPRDYNAINRVNDIEFTSFSKRGWRQHRRASDKVRDKAIAAIRGLIYLAPAVSPLLLKELAAIATELRTWPDMETEHGHQIDQLSNKAGWADWLRFAYDRMLEANEWGEARGDLRHSDWATLAATLFPEGDMADGISEARVGQILTEVKNTRDGRRTPGD